MIIKYRQKDSVKLFKELKIGSCFKQPDSMVTFYKIHQCASGNAINLLTAAIESFEATDVICEYGATLYLEDMVYIKEEEE